MTRYRLLDTVDWSLLHGTKVQFEVSEGYIIAKPLTKGATLTIIAQAIHSRPATKEPMLAESLLREPLQTDTSEGAGS